MIARVVIALFLVASLLVAGSYGMILMLPLRVQELGGDARDVGVLQFLIGTVAISTILISGRISDRIGQIRALGAAGAMIAFSLALFAHVDTLGLGVWVASAFYGFGWGLYFAFKLAVLARMTTAQTRFQVYALLSVAIMLGFGLWPVWGDAVARATGSVASAFAISAVLCLLGGSLFLLLRTPIHDFSDPTQATDAITVQGVAAVLRSPAWRPIALTFLTACVFSGMNSFQALFARARGFDYTGFFLAYTVATVSFRLLLGPLCSPRSAWGMTFALYGIMVGAVVLFAFSGDNPFLYLVAGAAFGLGYGVSSPIVQTLGANHAPPDVVTQSLQLLVVGHLTGVFGFPLIAGNLLVLAGETAVFMVMICICVIATAGSIWGWASQHKKLAPSGHSPDCGSPVRSSS